MLEFIRSQQTELLDRVTSGVFGDSLPLVHIITVSMTSVTAPKLVIVPIHNVCSPKELVHTGQLLALCLPAFPATHNPALTKGDEQRGFLTDLGEPWGLSSQLLPERCPITLPPPTPSILLGTSCLLCLLPTGRNPHYRPVPGTELRVSHLLGKCGAKWDPAPASTAEFGPQHPIPEYFALC